MSDNDIGDDGIADIALSLCKSGVKDLNVGKCTITFTGAIFLAQALLVSKNIKVLRLTGNPIPVEGLCLILQSAVNNTVCKIVQYTDLGYYPSENLQLLDEYSNDDEIQEMIKILESRNKKNEMGNANDQNESDDYAT